MENLGRQNKCFVTISQFGSVSAENNYNMLKKIKLFDLLLLLTGFLCGNLFAISFSNKNWNIFYIFFIVIFLEFSNKFIYFIFEKTKRNLEYSQRYQIKKLGTDPIKEWNQYQINSFGIKSLFGKGSTIDKNKFLSPTVDKITVSSIDKTRVLSLFMNLSDVKNIWFILINTLKRGFILGLFVEAFKVGS